MLMTNAQSIMIPNDCSIFCKVSLRDTLISINSKDVTGSDDAMLAKRIIAPAGTKEFLHDLITMIVCCK
jgi:hypothetical protein